MRRAIVLALVTSNCLGATSPAAASPKPLKTKQGASRASEPAASTSPEPDANVIPLLKQHFEYVLPGSCVTEIKKGPEFKCAGPDKDHLTCSGIVVAVHGKVDDCLQINVVKEK